MRASDRAYEALRVGIIQGDLAPGTVLTEVDLAERLGVSRTPVREALSRLGGDGLVSPGTRGAVVTELAPDDVARLFDVRIALEMQQVKRAARLRDPEVFHALAAQFEGAIPALLERRVSLGEHFELIRRLDRELDVACDNPYLVDALAGVRTHLARVRHRAGENSSRIAQAAREHTTIARAIAVGDSELAAHATYVHLSNSLANITASGESAATTSIESSEGSK